MNPKSMKTMRPEAPAAGARWRSRAGAAAASIALLAATFTAGPAHAVDPAQPLPTPIVTDAFKLPETYASGTVITTKYFSDVNQTHTIAMSIPNSLGGALTIVDLTAKTTLHQATVSTDQQMRVSKGSYIFPNRQVLLSTSRGELFHVNPNTLVVRQTPPIPTTPAAGSSPAVPPPSFLYEITGGKGADEYKAFVGSNNGHVYSFDFAAFDANPNGSQPWTDLGKVAETDDYVMSVGYADGYVYAGTGSSAERGVWKIKVSDPSQKTKLTIPDNSLNKAAFVTQTKVVGRYLYVTYDAPYPYQATHVYSLDSATWIDKEQGMFTITPPRLTWNPEPNTDLVYFKGDYNRLSFYDPRTATLGVKDMKQAHAAMATQGGQVPPNDCWVGTSTCVTVGGRGDFFLNDKTTGTVTEISPRTEGSGFYPGAVKGTGITELGPDGRVYMGSEYFSPNYLAITPSTGAASYLSNGPAGTNGQIEGMGSVNDKLVLGSYRSAMVAQYDPTQPESATNTSSAIAVSPSGDDTLKQARPHAVAGIEGGIAALGTMPEYNVNEGALAFYDTATRAMVGFRKGVVPNQSISTLAYLKGAGQPVGTIYGGSNTELGREGAVEQPEAALFKLTGQNGAVTRVYQPGVKTVWSLGFTKSGRLYAAVGTTAGRSEVREIDPATLTTIRTLDINSGSWTTLQPLTDKNGAEGLAVMSPWKEIFAIDVTRAANAPATAMVKHYLTQGIRPRVGTDGTWIFGKDGTVYSLKPTLENAQGTALNFEGFVPAG